MSALRASSLAVIHRKLGALFSHRVRACLVTWWRLWRWGGGCLQSQTRDTTATLFLAVLPPPPPPSSSSEDAEYHNSLHHTASDLSAQDSCYRRPLSSLPGSSRGPGTFLWGDHSDDNIFSDRERESESRQRKLSWSRYEFLISDYCLNTLQLLLYKRNGRSYQHGCFRLCNGCSCNWAGNLVTPKRVTLQ